MKKSDIAIGMQVERNCRDAEYQHMSYQPLVAKVIGEPFLKGRNLYYVNVQIVDTEIETEWYVRNISPVK